MRFQLSRLYPFHFLPSTIILLKMSPNDFVLYHIIVMHKMHHTFNFSTLIVPNFLLHSLSSNTIPEGVAALINAFDVIAVIDTARDGVHFER